MEQRNPRSYFFVLLKGMAMGAADVVPGVSGGTIAFISGIYEELIRSIDGIRPSLLGIWKKSGFKAFWNALNGNFLLAVFTGIAISVISLARGISWLLDNHPILVWAFFFGLVLASVIYIARQIEHWKWSHFLVFLLGAALAYLVINLPVSEDQSGLPFLFLSGALAVCAMILPGISGAFILVLLGSYRTVLEAVHQWDFGVLAVVALGAVTGLLSFARLLKWMFSRFKNLTLALLTGFILGSLLKIWPWKEVLETREIEDKIIVIADANVWPGQYDGDPMLIQALGLAILGFALIFLLERLATRKHASP